MQRQAWWGTALFGLLFAVLLVDVLMVGIDGLLERGNMVFLAVSIVATMGGYYGVSYVLRRNQPIVDERDRTIQGYANGVALAALTMVLFLVSILLFLVYESQGSVPVAWLWLMAYGSIDLAHLIGHITILTGYRSHRC
jgi:hypothetical protein